MARWYDDDDEDNPIVVRRRAPTYVSPRRASEARRLAMVEYSFLMILLAAMVLAVAVIAGAQLLQASHAVEGTLGNLGNHDYRVSRP